MLIDENSQLGLVGVVSDKGKHSFNGYSRIACLKNVVTVFVWIIAAQQSPRCVADPTVAVSQQGEKLIGRWPQLGTPEGFTCPAANLAVWVG